MSIFQAFGADVHDVGETRKGTMRWQQRALYDMDGVCASSFSSPRPLISWSFQLFVSFFASRYPLLLQCS